MQIDRGLSPAHTYMFASRNLLALLRERKMQKGKCVGREREEEWYWYQLHQQQLHAAARQGLLLLPCRAFKVSSSMPRKQSGTYISSGLGLACRATSRRICAYMEEAIN
jgi:hypothetical protein